MASELSIHAPSDIYHSDDASNTRPVPVTVYPEPIHDDKISDKTSTQSSRHSHPELTPVDSNVTTIDEVDAQGSKPSSGQKLNFKDAVARVRRDSAESIGTANDLLHPSSAAQPNNDLDEPDFWDRISQFTFRMQKDWRYFFQHPYARLCVAYLVTFCNFLIYAEDPVAHSPAECNIIVVGNIYSFVVTKYPPNGFSVLKVFLWLVAVLVGLVVGKLVVHRILLKRIFKLQMFQDDMGSFMIMFLTTLVSLYLFSWLYNAFLLIGGPAMEPYAINGLMDMRNSTFMKAAACGTWLGDFVTAWMVTDVMLQERFYPGWARGAKLWWNKGFHRIILFWCMAGGATIIVIAVIATDGIRWDNINASFLATNELSRAFLASFILVMDLLIVMQDWDFPHFVNHFDIKLPGLNTADLKINIPKCLKRLDAFTIHITGKWFNYGIIFLVMILDLNMWKNQIFYLPEDFDQFTDDEGFIYTNYTGGGPNSTDLYIRMESRYHGFSLPVKAVAFIPTVAAFVALVVLIIIYGRVKPTKADPYVGRLKKIRKSKSSQTMFAIVKMKIFGNRKTNSGNLTEEEVGQQPVEETEPKSSKLHNVISI